MEALAGVQANWQVDSVKKKKPRLAPGREMQLESTPQGQTQKMGA
jgi:hypothetical protein